MQKLRGNKFYQNHLRALELKREEEKADKEACKVMIMAYADQMCYDDDFDEEEMFAGSYTNKDKAQLQVRAGRNVEKQTKTAPAPRKKDVVNEDEADFDKMNNEVLNVLDQGKEDEEDEDDMLDAMARFVEG